MALLKYYGWFLNLENIYVRIIVNFTDFFKHSKSANRCRDIGSWCSIFNALQLGRKVTIFIVFILFIFNTWMFDIKLNWKGVFWNYKKSKITRCIKNGSKLVIFATSCNFSALGLFIFLQLFAQITNFEHFVIFTSF